MKKKLTAMLLALVMLLSATASVSAAGFADVPEDAFYYDAVNWAVEEGITNGLTETAFGPGEKCNRAQVVTFLWRLDGMPAASGENTFSDVADGSWYADAVLWAVEQKVTDGMGVGIFQPDGTCSRAQIVTFLWKYAGRPASDAENPFTDVPEEGWYAEAVKWAVEMDITTGISATEFCPDQPCNRAQIVTFLYRYAQMDDSYDDDPNMGEWA